MSCHKDVTLAVFIPCPEMYANEMHELCDRDHKVSPTLKSY